MRSASAGSSSPCRTCRADGPGALLRFDQCGGFMDVPDVLKADLRPEKRTHHGGVHEAGDVRERRSHEKRILRASRVAAVTERASLMIVEWEWRTPLGWPLVPEV